MLCVSDTECFVCFQALEYARSVPKPKVREHAQAAVGDTPRSGLSQVSTNGGRPVGMVTSNKNHTSSASSIQPEMETFDLAKLQERHEQDKQKAAMIRQNVEGAH